MRDYLKGAASTAKAPGGDKSWANTNPGPFLGVVKENRDPTKMGRLKVFIPTLAKADQAVESQLITCNYLAPFYGTKGERYVNPDGTFRVPAVPLKSPILAFNSTSYGPSPVLSTISINGVA